MKKEQFRTGSPVPTKPATKHRKAGKDKPGKAPKIPRATSGKKAMVPKVDRPMSGLDAAANVLADAGKPMRIGEVMEVIQKKGLWASKGKTPAATIFAAMIREISAKGADSRFIKKERGLFAAARKIHKA